MLQSLRLYAVLLLLATLSACATTASVPAPPPLEPPTADEPPPPPPAEDAPTDPLPDWYLLDADTDARRGVSVARAYDELLSGMTPQQTVVVAVIDSGVDIEHEDLAANIWRNPDEVPGNGADDDDNGYTDDVYGWNFIGGPGGSQVDKDTYEVTRELVRLQARFDGVNPENLTAEEQAEYDYYLRVRDTFEAEVAEYEAIKVQLTQVNEAVQNAARVVKGYLQTDTLSVAKLNDIGQSAPPDVKQSASILAYIYDQGFTADDVADQLDYVAGTLEYGLNPEFDPRATVGDNYADVNERVYGNAAVEGPDPSHGTHVAGIIAAVRGNGVGVEGIATAVEIMVLRAVPDGDERDKDIANAIRYAVDNGAHVINMSFGKGFSPQKDIVDAAVRYAAENDVLLVHAAGNDGEDIDLGNNFPTQRLADGSVAPNWIEVGASGWGTGDDLIASFSNYGQQYVDVFAPGYRIYATLPDNEYGFQDGTSMAAPVVSAVAATLRAYYPSLTAAQVKSIIVDTAVRYDEDVLLPGSEDEYVPFARLSATGGVVNLYRALQKAAEMAR